MTVNTIRILVADDDLALLTSMQKLLSLEGYRTDCAANGQLALEMAKAKCYDLIILDINMPVKNGWDAYEEISRITPLVPIVIVTARGRQEELANASGVSALLEKPFDIEHLLNLLKELLHQSKLERLHRLTGTTEAHYEAKCEDNGKPCSNSSKLKQRNIQS